LAVSVELGETNSEIIAGFNDRHLDFRCFSVSQNKRKYIGVSWPHGFHPHNFGGRLYLKANFCRFTFSSPEMLAAGLHSAS